MITPLLSNVHLHYGFDLWAERRKGREAAGELIMVRYADHIIVGFVAAGVSLESIGQPCPRLE